MLVESDLAFIEALASFAAEVGAATAAFEASFEGGIGWGNLVWACWAFVKEGTSNSNTTALY